MTAVAAPSTLPPTVAGGGSEGPVAIIGAGPAGLTAAHELAHAGRPAVVFEATSEIGGISRTVERDGWRFDIGGHRFFTKVPAVQQFWRHILPASDFLRRPRQSRILYRGTLFDYPLRPLNALANLGVVEAVRCVLSYLAVRIRPPADQSNFETWVAARFGWRLYRTFFKTYTEKVWGVDATRIQADWAAQRIKNLSLASAVINAFRPQRDPEITTLIDEFDYPALGPGMMWERAAEHVRELGVPVELRSAVTGIERSCGRATAVRTGRIGPQGRWIEDRTEVSAVVSSMPLGELVRAIRPAAPAAVLAAADRLRHRDFLTVALVVPQRFSFPDNWIYVHDPAVSVGRVQNFGSWSPHLVKDGRTCLGLEYFVEEGDRLWDSTDADLVTLATAELDRLGLVPADAVEAGYVVRQPKAYPVYDAGYHENVAILREWLRRHVPNVHPVGRNGMHRYNNADHSMLTAMLAVDNLLGARPPHDLWSVNVEADYHEEHRPAASRRGGTGRDAPILPARGVDQPVARG